MKKLILSALAALGLTLASSALAQAATVTLAWDSVTNGPTYSITNYSVYWSTVSGSYTNLLRTGTATTGTVSNLVNGVRYYFVATATENHGLESAYSAELSYTVPWKRPDAPTNFRVTGSVP